MDEVDTPHLGAKLESLPMAVVAAIKARDDWRKDLADRTPGLEFIVSDLQAWKPGATVRVAFLDGDAALHAEIVGATTQISDAMNLFLDFGFDEATGEYRRWSTHDTELQAEIRVSFDQGGYWSFVGTDSVDTTIDPSGGPAGGLPGQRSLNLEGFAEEKPEDWAGTTRHEFLHALGFQHEHQNMRGPCADDFRWEDDPGYVPTTNARGVFIMDAEGRSPGIYTYLGGPPNGWDKAQIDHNLQTTNDPGAVAGPFDAASVMLYRFAPFFYKTNPSPCAPIGDGQELSDGDKRGLALLYPAAVPPEMTAQASAALGILSSEAPGAGVAKSPYADRLIELLEERARS